MRLWDGAALAKAQPDERSVLRFAPLTCWCSGAGLKLGAAAQAPDGRHWLFLDFTGKLLLV